MIMFEPSMTRDEFYQWVTPMRARRKRRLRWVTIPLGVWCGLLGFGFLGAWADAVFNNYGGGVLKDQLNSTEMFALFYAPAAVLVGFLLYGQREQLIDRIDDLEFEVQVLSASSRGRQQT